MGFDAATSRRVLPDGADPAGPVLKEMWETAARYDQIVVEGFIN